MIKPATGSKGKAVNIDMFNVRIEDGGEVEGNVSKKLFLKISRNRTRNGRGGKIEKDTAEAVHCRRVYTKRNRPESVTNERPTRKPVQL